MTIYRIYKTEYESTYNRDPDLDETREICTSVKYVDSFEKVEAFFRQIEEYNKSCEQCVNCPIRKLTKRKYNNRRAQVDGYCDKKDLVFTGNNIRCNNSKYLDSNEYGYEQIEVE